MKFLVQATVLVVLMASGDQTSPFAIVSYVLVAVSRQSVYTLNQEPINKRRSG